MALTERLALLVTLDAKGAVQGLSNVGKAAEQNLGKADDRLSKVGTTMSKVGVGMVASGALIAGALYKAGQSASDLEQSVGGTEAVFKDASKTIEKFAKDAAQDMGLSERAFREATTSIGGQLKGVGFETEDAADQAVKLTQVAADLAATYGGTTADAVAALGSAFRGEADPAERFNLRLNQNTVNAKAVELGLAKSTASVDAHAKAQATLALIVEQSSDAQGQFARESDSAAGAQARFEASMENLKASLGGAVAPIIADVADKIGGLVDTFNKLPAPAQEAVSKIAAFGAAGLISVGAIGIVAGKVISLRENFSKLAETSPRTATALGAVGKAAGVLGIAVAGIQLVQLIKSTNQVTVNADKMAAALKDTSDAQQAANKEALLAADRYGKLDEVIREAAEANPVLADGLLKTAEAAGIGGDKLKGLRDIVNEKRTADKAGAEATSEYAAEQETTTGSVDGLTAALTEQEEALQGVLDATLAQFDSNLAYRNSVDEVTDKVAELNTLQKEGKTGSEEWSDGLRDLEGSLLSQAASAVKAAEDTATAAGKTLTAKEKAEIYKNELIKLKEQFPELAALIQGYIDKLNQIPTDKTTKLWITQGAGGFGQFNGRAGGGPVSMGKPYIVGEHRPELFVPNQSGRILPRVPTEGDAEPVAAAIAQLSDVLANQSPGGDTFNVYADPGQTALQAAQRESVWRHQRLKTELAVR